jgi:hypothetical protein
VFLQRFSLSVFAFGLLSLSTLLADQKTATKPVPREQSARAFLRLLNKGEFGQAVKAFDATMLKVLPPDELKKTWQKVVGQPALSRSSKAAGARRRANTTWSW